MFLRRVGSKTSLPEKPILIFEPDVRDTSLEFLNSFGRVVFMLTPSLGIFVRRIDSSTLALREGTELTDMEPIAWKML